VDIIDQGSGVEERQIPFLTQAFFRTDSARNLEKGGYGLGLPICQAIINQHGGSLAIVNIKPSGLKVTITLNKA
jgi:signal transduction histidine kinase